jgi:NAD(P)-dependent dehydrogenase (short-subunit alcohol dehydrogenase family)
VPDDVAAVVHFVCLPGSDFVTGQTIHVNGGQFLP